MPSNCILSFSCIFYAIFTFIVVTINTLISCSSIFIVILSYLLDTHAYSIVQSLRLYEIYKSRVLIYLLLIAKTFVATSIQKQNMHCESLNAGFLQFNFYAKILNMFEVAFTSSLRNNRGQNTRTFTAEMMTSFFVIIIHIIIIIIIIIIIYRLR